MGLVMTLSPVFPLFRHSRWDALPVLLALLHGALLILFPSFWLVALGVWWSSNTVAHYLIHKPFFRARRLNDAFGLYLTALLGIPQTLWRDRHLAHHAERPWRFRMSRRLAVETALIIGIWAALLCLAPRFFLFAYLPGYAAGLALCALHGHHEHARGTTSHHGRLYNFLFFNDGYHVEHHRAPGLHWRELPAAKRTGEPGSRWPAVLRWIDALSLENLERLALHWPALQRFLVARHEAAFRRLLPEARRLRRIGIVGGGLFPRTARVLRRLAPGARLVIIDRSAANLATARRLLGGGVRLVHATYDPAVHGPFDLLVVPLAYAGNREALYGDPPAPVTLVHDWLWRPRGRSALISLLLLKRLNRVEAAGVASRAQARAASRPASRAFDVARA
jgi:hypothetical protein